MLSSTKYSRISTENRWRYENILLAKASTPAPRSIQFALQWVTEALCLSVKIPGTGPDHSLPSSAELNN